MYPKLLQIIEMLPFPIEFELPPQDNSVLSQFNSINQHYLTRISIHKHLNTPQFSSIV